MDDYLALDLAGPEGLALRERLRAELPGPYLLAFSRWVCARARFPEDIVERATASGVSQYVILGAGLDSWIGVTMYLTLDAIQTTLATMAQCRAGTRVVLSYNQPPAALEGLTAQIAAAFAGLAAELGEPFVSRFLPGEIEQLLRGHGFGEIADFGPQEARAAYFQGRADVDIAGAQRLVAATVGRVRQTRKGA
jgi:O-methyltransferase involved in polyketide biosynthesis